MTTTFADYKQKNAGAGSIFADSGVWIRAVNNTSALAYVSTTSTDANGLYVMTGVPPGSYTLSSGPSSIGPWTPTGDGNYIVPINADDTGPVVLKGTLEVVRT